MTPKKEEEKEKEREKERTEEAEERSEGVPLTAGQEEEKRKEEQEEGQLRLKEEEARKAGGGPRMEQAAEAERVGGVDLSLYIENRSSQFATKGANRVL